MSEMMEVRVPNLDCEGCAAKIKRALFKVDGVEGIEVEMENKKVTVRGYAVEQKKVLKAIKRAGKAVEPWPFAVPSSHYASFYKYPTYVTNHYYDTSRNVAPQNVQAFFHTPAVYSVAVASDEAAASLFSDDNPHACAIM